MAKKSAFNLEQNIPFLVHRLASRMAAVANERYKKEGINTLVVRVLLVLWTNKEATVGELCEATTIDQSTVSHMLKRLMARQLITKKREDRDNRAVRVSLTAKGAKLAESCAEIASNYERQALGIVSGEKAAEFRRMLVAMYRNFDDAA